MPLTQQIDEICAMIESMGIKGIVFKNGYFQAEPMEDVPNTPHQQMFHIRIKEIPS